MTANVIEDGVNGFITNDKVKMRGSLERLLANPGLCSEMGKRARQTIEDRYSLASFISNWNEVLLSTANKVVNV
jgi:glycosyltransferase involved in cell wall biosynthesis